MFKNEIFDTKEDEKSTKDRNLPLDLNISRESFSNEEGGVVEAHGDNINHTNDMPKTTETKKSPRAERENKNPDSKLIYTVEADIHNKTCL